MRFDPHISRRLKEEFADLELWQTRVVVLAFGVFSGLTVVAFTWLSDQALAIFHWMVGSRTWMALLWSPVCTAGVVWATQRWFAGAAGSGIPQVMAALSPNVSNHGRRLFVSTRLTLGKMALTAAGLMGGLSLGREGPSVQIAAGVMHAARRWLPAKSSVSEHGLLIAGGSAGIAAAFNTPLGGIMFAIEELSRRPEQRSNGLVMAAIVLAGLMGISFHGNATYFGVIKAQQISWSLMAPGVMVALASGLAGGLFARLMTVSLAGTSADRFTRWRRDYPIRFAAGCGLAIALIGLATGGSTFGSGYGHNRDLLEGGKDPSNVYMLLKFIATWITTWSGVPGGIFAPCLAIGGSLGSNVAQLMGAVDSPSLIALGMAGFLAAVTQAPMTAFIIVMEMVDGYNLVLSLMTCAMVASTVSRILCRPLYHSLADLQLARLRSESAP